MKIEILATDTTKIPTVWDFTPYSLADNYQYSEEYTATLYHVC
jgi:hypothetical protein